MQIAHAILRIGLLFAVPLFATAAESERIPTVVTSNGILQDMVKNVGGDRVHAACMLPPGIDVHAFDPTPDTIVQLTEADLLVAYGLWLDDVEQLRVDGDLEDAREYLRELVEAELHFALQAASDETALQACGRLDQIAGSLGVLQVQSFARAERVRRLSKTLSVDDSVLLDAKQNLALTPDIQFIKDPALNPNEDSIWVIGLRARLAL